MITSFLLIVYKTEVGRLLCSLFALGLGCPRISRKIAGGYRANVTCQCRGVCAKLKFSITCERICKATCLMGNLFEMYWVLANENYQLTRPVASPNVKTQCHYVSIGIRYVTMSWATADNERAILGPRNSAVDISCEVLQLLLGDVKEYTNQWIKI